MAKKGKMGGWKLWCVVVKAMIGVMTPREAPMFHDDPFKASQALWYWRLITLQ